MMLFPEWKQKRQNSWNRSSSWPLMHVSMMQTRFKSIFPGRPAPRKGCPKGGRRCGGASTDFSHGKLEKGGSGRGERSARRARNGDEAIFSECGRAPPAGNRSATGRHRSARPSRALSTRALPACRKLKFN